MKRKKTVAVVVVAAAAVAAAGFFLAGREEVSVDRYRVEPETFRQVVSATGTVQGRVLTLQSELTARVVEVLAEEGDAVEQEQLLLRLDDGDLQKALRQRQADLRLAETRSRSLAETRVVAATEDLTQLQQQEKSLEEKWQRQKALFERGALAAEVLEETETQMELLASQVRAAQNRLSSLKPGGAEAAETAALVSQAQVNLETLQQDLAKTAIVSPISGNVLERHIEVGEVATAGTPLMVIGKEELFVEVEMDERHLGLLEIGQEAVVWPEAFSSEEVSARVEWMAPRVDSETGTLTVRLQLLDEAPFLRRDMTVQSQIEVRTLADALLLPAAWLYRKEPAAVLVEEEGIAVERRIEVQPVGVDQLLVLGGLEAGVQVMDPESGLAPGDTIQPE